MVRYLAALAVMVLTLLGGGTLALAPLALGLPPARGWGDPARLDLVTGCALALLGLCGIAAWSIAWYRRLRADGVLPGRPAPGAGADRPTPADDLTPVLMPLVAALTAQPPGPAGDPHGERPR